MRWSALTVALLTLGCRFDPSGLDPFEAGGPAPDFRAPDSAGSDVNHDGLPVFLDLPKFDGESCPASCVVGCLPGTQRCITPSNVAAADLASITPCGAHTVPRGATWTLCTGAKSAECRLVEGTKCGASPRCQGENLEQSEKTPDGATRDACVFSLQGLVVDSGALLAASGSRPAILVVTGPVTIGGTIDASGDGTGPGPGAGQGGKADSKTKNGRDGSGPPGLSSWSGASLGGTTAVCSSGGDDSGGGGGGFATRGGDGGREAGCAPRGQGGPVYGDPELAPLVGGSGGGSGNDSNGTCIQPGAGGGGGGAIQITGQSVQLTGAVLANGGPGAGGLPKKGASGAGGGGGSGGGVLLEAAVIVGSGWVMAGGGGGGGGGDGDTPCHGVDGEQSAPGSPEQQPTGGGGCKTTCPQLSGTCGDGGDGAWGAGSVGGPFPNPAEPGGDGTGGQGAGGGGGGGAGYLRFNTGGAGASCPPSGIKVTGLASCGVVKAR